MWLWSLFDAVLQKTGWGISSTKALSSGVSLRALLLIGDSLVACIRATFSLSKHNVCRSWHDIEATSPPSRNKPSTKEKRSKGSRIRSRTTKHTPSMIRGLTERWSLPMNTGINCVFGFLFGNSTCSCLHSSCHDLHAFRYFRKYRTGRPTVQHSIIRVFADSDLNRLMGLEDVRVEAWVVK